MRYIQIQLLINLINCFRIRYTHASKPLPNVSDLSFRRHFVRSSVFSPLRVPCQNNGTIHKKNSCDNGLAPLRGFRFSGFFPESIATPSQPLRPTNEYYRVFLAAGDELEMGRCIRRVEEDHGEAKTPDDWHNFTFRPIFVGHYLVAGVHSSPNPFIIFNFLFLSLCRGGPPI